VFKSFGLTDHQHMLQAYLFGVGRRRLRVVSVKLSVNAVTLTEDRQSNQG
jgi:hypothetical protein